jgi:hypothetical protein
MTPAHGWRVESHAVPDSATVEARDVEAAAGQPSLATNPPAGREAGQVVSVLSSGLPALPLQRPRGRRLSLRPQHRSMPGAFLTLQNRASKGQQAMEPATSRQVSQVLGLLRLIGFCGLIGFNKPATSRQVSHQQSRQGTKIKDMSWP